MDKEMARTLIDKFKKFDAICNEITEFSDTLPDKEAKAVRRVIAEAISRAYVDVLRPIIKIDPDLDPDN